MIKHTIYLVPKRSHFYVAEKGMFYILCLSSTKEMQIKGDQSSINLKIILWVYKAPLILLFCTEILLV